MTLAEYRRRTVAQWRGVKLRTKRELSNGNMVIPRGTVVEVDGKCGGFSLRTERCPCCGVRIRISRVPPNDVEVVK